MITLPHIHCDDLFLHRLYILGHLIGSGLKMCDTHLHIHSKVQSVFYMIVQAVCVGSDMCGCNDGNNRLDAMVTTSYHHHPPSHIVVIVTYAPAKGCT